MILHVYFARRFLTTFLFVMSIFFGILILIDLVEQVRRFEGDGVAFPALIGMTLLSVPETLYAILPLLVIIATLTLFLSLARTSELVVSRASGRSAYLSLFGPVVVTLLIGVTAVTVVNPIVAATSRQYDILQDRLEGRTRSTLALSDEGVWLRQGSDTGQTVIHAGGANADGTDLTRVSFIGFTPSGGPAYRIEAARARLEDGGWTITDAKEWRFDAPNPEQSAQSHETLRLPSTLTANQILDSFGDPATIPIWALPGFIEEMRAAGFSARRHVVYLQMELALPVLLVAMVLTGAVFTMRHTRVARAGAMVLSALTLGFALFFIRNFAQILGESGQIPPGLAAWGPPAAAILLPLGLLLHWEDG